VEKWKTLTLTRTLGDIRSARWIASQRPDQGRGLCHGVGLSAVV